MRQLVDTNGNVTLAKAYQPYGEELSRTGSGSSTYGYTGEMTDPTGLVYLRARYLDPAQGRFISRDGWEGDDSMPISYNRWLYGFANPVNITDPSGQNPAVVAALLPSLIGAGAGFATGALAGGAFGWCTYEWALAGECGCNLQQQALSMTKWEWTGAHALGAGIIGGVGGAIAAAAPIGLIAVGVVGAIVSGADIYNTYQIIKNETGITACTITRLIMDVVGIVFSGVGIIKGVQQWRASGSVLRWIGGIGIGVTRPGYSGPTEGWANTKPADLIFGQSGTKIQEAIANGDYRPPSFLVGADSSLVDTAKFIYVINENGAVVVTRTTTGLHHPDLVNGSNAYGAGEMFINQQGKIVLINDRSGHYRPHGNQFFPYMHYLLQQMGLNVSKNVFQILSHTP